MRQSLVRKLAAATALAAAAIGAQASAVSASTTQFTLSGWAYGSGNAVQTAGYAGLAGGLVGSLSGSGAYDMPSFVTYSLRSGDSPPFSAAPLQGYSVLSAVDPTLDRRGNALLADQLGRLMSYVAAYPARVDDAASSTALQLAIWSLVAGDDMLAGGGLSGEFGAYAVAAQALLAGAQGVGASRYDVYALQNGGGPGYLLLLPKAGMAATDVPEPGSLALAAAALAGLALLRRRRGVWVGRVA